VKYFLKLIFICFRWTY